jgi:hypothetical protein
VGELHLENLAFGETFLGEVDEFDELLANLAELRLRLPEVALGVVEAPAKQLQLGGLLTHL